MAHLPGAASLGSAPRGQPVSARTNRTSFGLTKVFLKIL